MSWLHPPKNFWPHFPGTLHVKYRLDRSKNKEVIYVQCIKYIIAILMQTVPAGGNGRFQARACGDAMPIFSVPGDEIQAAVGA